MNTTFLSLMVLSQSDNFEEQKLAEFFYLLKVSQKGSWAFFFFFGVAGDGGGYLFQ